MQVVPLFRAAERRAETTTRNHHGIDWPERRRQVHHHSHLDGIGASRSRRSARARPSHAPRADRGEVGYWFRLRGHAPVRFDDSGLAHQFYEVNVSLMGRPLRAVVVEAVWAGCGTKDQGTLARAASESDPAARFCPTPEPPRAGRADYRP